MRAFRDRADRTAQSKAQSARRAAEDETAGDERQVNSMVIGFSGGGASPATN